MTDLEIQQKARIIFFKRLLIQFINNCKVTKKLIISPRMNQNAKSRKESSLK